MKEIIKNIFQTILISESLYIFFCLYRTGKYRVSVQEKRNLSDLLSCFYGSVERFFYKQLSVNTFVISHKNLFVAEITGRRSCDFDICLSKRIFSRIDSVFNRNKGQNWFLPYILVMIIFTAIFKKRSGIFPFIAFISRPSAAK